MTPETEVLFLRQECNVLEKVIDDLQYQLRLLQIDYDALFETSKKQEDLLNDMVKIRDRYAKDPTGENYDTET